MCGNSLISIIIPVYNSEKTLRRCMDSVINQSYKNIELIAVDDGSRDSSLEILNEYAGLDKRILVLHKENGGQSSARNLALENMRGDFFCFVDSDDEIFLDYIERLYIAIEESDADISLCGITRSKKGVTSTTYVYEPFLVKGKKAIISDFLRERFVFGPVSKLFRAELFGSVRFTEGMIFEDIEYLSRAYLRAESVQSIEYAGYIAYENENSTVHSAFDVKKLDLLKANDKILALYEGLDGLCNERQLFRLNSYLGVLLMAKTSEDKRKFNAELSRLRLWIRKNLSGILRNKLVPRRKKLYATVYGFNLNLAIRLLDFIRNR